MAALQVWSRAELDDRERVFQALVVKALRLSARSLEQQVGGLLTAASAPNVAPEPEARSTAFALALGELGTVQATWTARVDAELMPYVVQTFADAAADTAKLTGRGEPVPALGFISRTLAFIRTKLVALGDWLTAKLAKTLQAAYDAGAGIQQLASSVRAAAADAAPTAGGVAADALGWASTLGELTQLQAAGFTDAEVEKQWLTADDDRVRPAHEEADGQRVGLFQSFSVGGEQLFAPRDPTGRPDNVIRCRCSLGYIFNTDDADDGTGSPLIAHGGDSHNQKDHGRHGRTSVDVPDSNPFRILSKSERGKSGDGMYAPGMWGKYGAAGIMMRHVDDSGKARYLVVQRANPGKNQWRWQLPGGAIDENETPAQGAAREAFEEVGATPELLAQLTPRGEHAITRPVEGKAPWRYTNVVADAPYQFTPKVDRSEGELWKALWLTEEQLLEMRGRNRLVAPFAENLEKIIAKFDEPTVAAADPDWDESKHPRAPKGTGKGGQFISKPAYGIAATEKVKKATAAQVKSQVEAAKIPVGKPLHVNTAVIYKTQYNDGAVVAVNPGAAARLSWSAPDKKFLYQERQAAGNWQTTATYGKGDAYKKFSKESGWHEPAPTKTALATPSPALSPSPTPVTPSPLMKPVKLNTATVYKNKYSHGAVVAEKPGGSPEGYDERLTWDGNLKKFVLERYLPGLSKWDKVKTYNKGETYKNFSEDDGWFAPGTIKTPSSGTESLTTTLPSTAPSAPTPETSTFLSTDVDLSEYGVVIDGKQSLAIRVAETPGQKNSYVTVGYITFDPAGFNNQTVYDFNQQKVAVLSAGVHELNELLADKVNAGQLKFPDPDWTPPSTTPAPAPSKLPNLSMMTSSQLNMWFSQLTQAEFNELTEAEVDQLDVITADEAAFDNFEPYNKLELLKNGVGDNIPGDPGHVISDLTHGHIDWTDDGPEIDGESSVIIKVPTNSGDLIPVGYAVIESGYVTSGAMHAKLYTLDKVQTGAIVGSTFREIKGKIADKLNEGNGAFIAPLTPSPTPAPAPVVKKFTPGQIPDNKSDLSGYVHQEITQVGDIGVPDTSYAGEYLVLSKTQAADMQSAALAQAGKKWTTQEIQAVQRYTTSVGYQTTNAVLRNDQTRLNMFSVPQLKEGVKNAQALQSAMVPMGVASKVFRGTGAQAFGSPNKNISFDDLKKFEGKTITDEGFVSTTILDEKSTGFDYTKKPIRMEIEVPPGTPALYVSSATPGYSSENELILAAGTSMEIIEVRKATAAEKAAHSSSLDYVVRARVVPTVKSSTSPPAPKVTPSATSVDPTSSVAPKKVAKKVPGKVTPSPTASSKVGASTIPLKMNTGTIYKTKYVHGTVVAVRHLYPDSAERVAWSEHLKKFVVQRYDSTTQQWSTVGLPKITYSKKEAYDTFSKIDGWLVPQAGQSAVGTPAFGGAYTPTPLPANAPGASSTPKSASSFTVIDLKAQSKALASSSSPDAKTTIFKTFKTGSGVGSVALSSASSKVFSALVHAQDKLNKSGNSYTLLDLLTVIDEKSTPVGKTNDGLYEKKIVEWLKTASGAGEAAQIINDLDAGASTVNTLKSQIPKPADIGTPKADVSAADFSTITPAQATALQKKMMPNSELTDAQRQSIANYTSSGYTSINGVLRGKNVAGADTAYLKKMLAHAKNIQDAMRPLPQSIITYRGTGPEQFPGLTSSATIEDVRKFLGKTIIDDGFVSSSVSTGSAFGNKIQLTIEAPAGTPARYVAGISSLSHERELMYAAGTQFKVIEVTPGAFGNINVRLRVVP